MSAILINQAVHEAGKLHLHCITRHATRAWRRSSASVRRTNTLSLPAVVYLAIAAPQLIHNGRWSATAEAYHAGRGMSDPSTWQKRSALRVTYQQKQVA
jgi:hypothetical protein